MRVQRTEEPASPRRAHADAAKSWSFELRIRPQGHGFGVHLLSSPAGDEVAELVLPPSLGGVDRAVADLASAVRSAARHLQAPRVADGSLGGDARLRAVGGALFTALFPEPVRRRWDECVAEVAPRPGRALRLVLKSDPTCRATADLHRLPWELLRDPRTGGYLALSRKTRLVRQLALDELPVLEEPKPERRLRVLAVLSLPPGVDALDLARERQRIAEAVAGRPEIELTVLEDPTFAELTETLRAERFHVLHFMGHGAFDPGSGQGCLLLAGAGGGPERVAAERLAQVVRDLDSLRLVVLNACDTGRTPGGAEEPFTGLAHALVRGGVPAVLAMQLPIPDGAAVELSRVFYRRLAAGEAVDEALAEARVAVYAAGGSGAAGSWAVPVLFVRRQELAIFRPRRAEEDGGAEAGRAIPPRWRRWLPAVAVLALAAAVASLFFLPAPWAGVELQVEASSVAFTLTAPQTLVDALDLAELAVPDVAALSYPDAATGRTLRAIAAATSEDTLGLLATTGMEGSGGLSLDGRVLPAGTRIGVSWTAPRELRLSLDLEGAVEGEAEPEITASTGPGVNLRLVPARSGSFRLDPRGGRLVMVPRDRRIDIDLTLAASRGGGFHTPLDVEALHFVEVREEGREGPERRTRIFDDSTLRSGHVSLAPLGGGRSVELDLLRHQRIAFAGLRGEITRLTPGEEGLLVELRGRVDEVASIEPDGRRVDLTPTWSRTPWALGAGAASGALLLLSILAGHLRTLINPPERSTT
ncbi:MAG TPA: CHAT domain-containing protein [Thermoanaerobaculia bacterium]|nr:CHAT domain-containing protein [Thermoanaerobaculia bacterium]